MNLDKIKAWYTDRYAIYHKDIDFQGELRLTALLLMLQETAWNHAHSLGISYSDPGFEKIVWVLSRMRIELFGPGPGWMDEVRLVTSPTGIDRLFALRDFVAMNQAGVPFARISSAWIMIDSDSRRPIRPQTLLTSVNFQSAESILPGGTTKLKEPNSAQVDRRHLVGWSDIDAHQHVNNVRYVEWCLDSYPPDYWREHAMVDFDINFNAETVWGQEIETMRMIEQEEPEQLLGGSCIAERHIHGVRPLGSHKFNTVLRFGWGKRHI